MASFSLTGTGVDRRWLAAAAFYVAIVFFLSSRPHLRAFGPEFPKLLFPQALEDTTETQISGGRTRTDPGSGPRAPTLGRGGGVGAINGRPEVRGIVERASLIQALIWILVISAGLIVGIVLKILFSAP